MIIVDGNQIALEITQRIARDIFDNSLEDRPGLAIILAGNRDDSALYVDIKQQRAKEVGIDTHLYKIEDSETTEDIVGLIKHLNEDSEIDGILVQLPLPKKYNTDIIISSIDPDKDVDFFHPDNVKKLDNYQEEKLNIISPVHGAVLLILEKNYFELAGRKVVLLVNSEVFAGGLKKILEAKGAEVEIVFPTDSGFKDRIKTADLLVTAVGKKNLITGEMVKPNVAVIDVGITKDEDGVWGDVDFEEVKEMSSFITPVPGGVGPITVAKVLENVRKLHKEHRTRR